MHHYHCIHPRLRGVRNTSHAAGIFPSGSLSPAQVLTAYGFKQNQFAGVEAVVLGIGSLGGGVVQADIDNAVQAWRMAAPHLTIRTVGGATNDPVSDQDSNVENMLDLLIAAYVIWYLTGKAAKIVFTIGPNISGGMKLVTDDLVAAGCKSMNWSWGSPKNQGDPAENAALGRSLAAAVAAGCTCCAAAGDNSIDDGTSAPSADYPCADPNVWAVGGTCLTLKADGTIQLESAWGDGRPGDEGGGGGFDPTVPTPSWQSGVVPAGLGRGVPDTSANADPQSGWQISANGSWTVVGGTSASSPFTAALVAVAKGAYGQLAGMLSPLVYASRKTACNDITTGSNGDPAKPGWDPATGLGSPNGPAFLHALVGSNPTAPPPVIHPPAPTAPAVTLAQAQAWAADGLAKKWPAS